MYKQKKIPARRTIDMCCVNSRVSRYVLLGLCYKGRFHSLHQLLHKCLFSFCLSSSSQCRRHKINFLEMKPQIFFFCETPYAKNLVKRANSFCVTTLLRTSPLFFVPPTTAVFLDPIAFSDGEQHSLALFPFESSFDIVLSLHGIFTELDGCVGMLRDD